MDFQWHSRQDELSSKRNFGHEKKMQEKWKIILRNKGFYGRCLLENHY
jgi:hypothetical protein